MIDTAPHLGHPSSAPARALMEAVLASEAARIRGASTESRSGMEPHLSGCCNLLHVTCELHLELGLDLEAGRDRDLCLLAARD